VQAIASAGNVSIEKAAGEDIDNFALAEALFACCVGRIGADRKGYAHL
jgi:hypothetical protein